MIKPYHFEDSYPITTPDDITPQTFLCCNEDRFNCLDPKSFQATWSEALSSLIHHDGVRLAHLYHPDTRNTCAGCQYFGMYQCPPLREMLYSKFQFIEEEYQSITPCRYYMRDTFNDEPVKEKAVPVTVSSMSAQEIYDAYEGVETEGVIYNDY